MRVLLSVFAITLLVVACGKSETAGTDASAGQNPTVADVPPVATADSTRAQSAPTTTAAQNLAGRTGELVNPGQSAMVFLYYDLAGIAAPIDNWVEADSRVKFAPGIEKAANRAALRAELEAGAAGVRGVGLIRQSLNDANLSHYDPTYGEFRVGALAPSSFVEFTAFGQKVALKFGNGRTAQIWSVPEAEAQVISDKIPRVGRVAIDTVLKIKSVQPGPGGGTIIADVLEFELRHDVSGTTIGRVQVAQQ